MAKNTAKRRLVRISGADSDELTHRRLNARLEAYGDKVTILGLADKLGAEPRKIRAILRGMGMRAQKVGIRRQYVWDSDSKELRKIEGALRKKLKA